jgi:hypothetical protein
MPGKLSNTELHPQDTVATWIQEENEIGPESHA